MDKTIDYTVNLDSEKEATISGKFRLSSPNSYETVFSEIKIAMEKGPKDFVLDLRNLTFLNSAGITSLARLIITGREHNVPITIKGSDLIAWQLKTLDSLRRLWSKVTISFD